MEKQRTQSSLDELASEIFNNEFIDSILFKVYRDSCQFIRLTGDKRAYLFTRRLTERANEIKQRLKSDREVKLRAVNHETVNVSDFNYLFFPYIAEEGDHESILLDSYPALQKSLCEQNQHLVIVVVDIDNRLQNLKQYHIDIGYFIGGFEKRNSQYQ